MLIHHVCVVLYARSICPVNHEICPPSRIIFNSQLDTTIKCIILHSEYNTKQFRFTLEIKLSFNENFLALVWSMVETHS